MNYLYKKLLLLTLGLFCTQLDAQDTAQKELENEILIGLQGLFRDQAAPVVVFGGPAIKTYIAQELKTATTYKYAMYEDRGIGDEYTKNPKKKYGITHTRPTEKGLMHHKVLQYRTATMARITGTGSCHWSEFLNGRGTFNNPYEDFLVVGNNVPFNRRCARLLTLLKTEGGKEVQDQKRLPNPALPDPNTNYPVVYFSPTMPGSPSIITLMVHLIDNEKKSIKMAYECISHARIVSALIAAQKRTYTNSKGKECNIKVTILHDKDKIHDKFNTEPKFRIRKNEDQSLIPLIAAGCLYTNKIHQVHHKFTVFRKNVGDKQLLVTGSSNLSYAAEHKNNEDIAVFDDPYVVESYKERFDWYINHDPNIIQGSWRVGLDFKHAKYGNGRITKIEQKRKERPKTTLTIKFSKDIRKIKVLNTLTEDQLSRSKKLTRQLEPHLINTLFDDFDYSALDGAKHL